MKKGDTVGKRPGNYSTKQRSAVLEYLKTMKDRHVTAAGIAAHFAENNAGETVGRTTVYRQLERLEREGLIRKYTGDANIACYQFTGGDEEPASAHYHLKCENCGGLFHLRCRTLECIAEHILREHDFRVDSRKTVYYGICGACAQKTTGSAKGEVT
jgi:Fur family ferric uptake transcriptional regulator